MELQAVKALSIKTGKIALLIALLFFASLLSLGTGEINISFNELLHFINTLCYNSNAKVQKKHYIYKYLYIYLAI